MSIVIIALIPAMLFGMWNVGYQHALSIGASWEFWQNVLVWFSEGITAYCCHVMVLGFP